MKLQISLVSSEVIKPSSSTPPHPTHYKLSIIDQYVPPVTLPFIFFYPAVKDTVNFDPTRILKSSLSETLADFYPLAGRISDNRSILCNDAGVNFLETRVTGRKLDQVVTDAAVEEMEQLLPKDRFEGSGPKVLLSVQFNKFDCGGMALAMRISHKVTDASTLSLFLQNWAASARGNIDKVTRPRYDIPSILPGRDSVSTLEFPTGKPNQKLVAKRFVLSASNIAALKARCEYRGLVKKPTRAQSVTALIWKSTMNALRKARADVKPLSLANVAVNLRGRMTPPLSNQSVGNMIMTAMAVSGTEETDLGALVDKIQTAITDVDIEFVKQLQVDEELQASVAESFKQVEDFESCTFTSWLRLPFYETDFGWGRPTLMGYPGRFTPNSAVFFDTKDGGGMEVWVVLHEPEMACFEVDPDIIAFTSNASRL